MKRVSKSSKKGFTLVELIVVLVILAILAAMLVPALTGYIRKAREEKEFQAASSLYTAAQACATEAYGKITSSTTVNATYYAGYITVADLEDLTGLDIQAAKFTITNFGGTSSDSGAGIAEVTGFSVQFSKDGTWYNYSTTGGWTTGTGATASTDCADSRTTTGG